MIYIISILLNFVTGKISTGKASAQYPKDYQKKKMAAQNCYHKK